MRERGAGPALEKAGRCLEGLGISSDYTRKPPKRLKEVFKEPFFFPVEKPWRGAK